MKIQDLDLSQLEAVTLKNQSDTNCLVIVMFRDGHMDVAGAPIEEAALLKMRFDEFKQSVVLVDDTAGPPIAQSPCQMCNQIHPAEGNPVCVCQFCFQLKEIVHPGGICADCGRHRYPGQFGGFVPNFHV